MARRFWILCLPFDERLHEMSDAMTDINTRLAALLIDLEAELRNMQLWDKEPPAAQALASVEPFCVDTLDFYQWLQFVFLERMRALLEAQAQLPDSCQIAPMAEQCFSEGCGSLKGLTVINVLKQIDQIITDQQ